MGMVSSRDTPMPTAPAQKPMIRVSALNIPETFFLEAPMARRTPISFVRSCTEIRVITPIIIEDTTKEIATKAGCPEWAVRKYQGQAKSFSLEQIKMAISDGVNYEEAVKTGRMNDQMAVELFVVNYSKA